MSNIIDKIQLSGVTYDIGGQGGSGVSVVEVTQAEYDALPSSAKTDTSKMYVITDAQAGDLTNYYTKTETNTLLGGKADTATTYTKTEVDNAITAATATKQDTLVSSVNIKTINNTSILGSGNIDIQGGGGGGKAVSGGTNISITTGETADTINCTLNLENGTNSQSGGIKLKSAVAGNEVSGRDASAFGGANKSNGINSFVTGFYNTGETTNAFISGYKNKTTNSVEALFGVWALSNGSQTGDPNGYSDATLFAVGNGDVHSHAKHNAFEIRQNGDIYIADTNDASTTNWYQKPMIKLQDTVSATTANTTALGGLKLVKLTQSAYDALSPNYDSNTLYVIVN